MKPKNTPKHGPYGAYADRSEVGRLLGERNGPRSVLQRLKDLQAKQGCVSPRDIEAVSRDEQLSPAEVYANASFYSQINIRVFDDDPSLKRVLVCDGPSCRLNGAGRQLAALDDDDHGLIAERTSCLGQCQAAPVTWVNETLCGPVTAESVNQFTSDSQLDTLSSKAATTVGTLGEAPSGSEWPLTGRFAFGGAADRPQLYHPDQYAALATAMDGTPNEVIELVTRSGLRGQGGAGYPTGNKWRMVAEAVDETRYVVCNADESEPGTFKDRVLMEYDPHLLLEGMAICAYAVGAHDAYVYIRGEYTQAAQRLRDAMQDVQQRPLISSLTSRQPLRFHLHEGAGAYICGEETALIESLEGRRGEPSCRPPFPTTCGLFEKPTVVNNVETLCNVPWIVIHGHDAFAALGKESSSGTKLFCLSGHVRRPGVYEAPWGVTTRELIDGCGRGLRDASKPKFVITGGAAGTFLPSDLWDKPLTFEAHLNGIAIGSGALIVADESVNAAEALSWIIDFFVRESCGKCTPCRVGTDQAQRILHRIVAGQCQVGDLDRLRQLANSMERLSLCGLGQTAAWPIKSAIDHFPEDFETLGAS